MTESSHSRSENYIKQFLVDPPGQLSTHSRCLKKLPAGDEEDNTPGPGASRPQSTAAAEALARNHNKSLTRHQEQERPNSESRRDVRVIDTVPVVLIRVLFRSSLHPQRQEPN